MDYDEKIQDYLDGQMSQSEINSFEMVMNNNPTLKNEVAKYQSAKDVAKYLLEYDIKTTLDKYRIENDRGKSFASKYWMVILISLIVLVTGFLIARHFQKKAKETEERKYDLAYVEPMWPIVRSGGSDLQMQKAMYLFLTENKLDQAKTIILTDTLLDVTMRKYWVFEMYLKSNNVDSAKVYLPVLPDGHPKAERVNLLKKIFKF